MNLILKILVALILASVAIFMLPWVVLVGAVLLDMLGAK